MLIFQFRRLGLILTATAIVALAPYSAGAQNSGLGGAEVSRTVSAGGKGISRRDEKIGAFIRERLDQLRAQGITRANARARGASGLSTRLVRIDDQAAIQTYVHIASLSAAQRSRLEGLEVRIEHANTQAGMVQAWIPADRIEAVADLDFVTKVVRPDYARTRAGSVQTEGDSILRANELRAQGFNGAGVKVGVISDGADGLAAAVASGDLPSGVMVFGNCFGSCAEGTAMLEIIHDLAPGAQLAVSETNTSLDFINGVSLLANTFGADIIVDDLGFFGEPFFADGPIAQAVAAVTNNVLFVTAGGNDGEGHYEANFLSTPGLFGFPVHNFGAANGGASDRSMTIDIPPGGFVDVFLQWNDPFQASGNDYDLFLYNASETGLLASSLGIQDGDDEPSEFITYFNPNGFTVRTLLQVEKFSGADKRLEFFVLSNGVTIVDPYNIPSGSIFGHPAVQNAVTVAAIDAVDPGHDTIEPFSSRGPARIDFPSVVSRPKPEITGIDGVSVSGAGGFPSTFFGTSAAAPHIAAIAAQLQQKVPTATPAALRTALADGAVDLGPVGRDSVFGWGRADAIAASAALDTAQSGIALPWLPLLLD